MATYVPTPGLTRPRAHTESGSPATLAPGSFAPSSRQPVNRAQIPIPLSHGHRTVSASMMDGASRNFAVPPSPGIANPMMTLPPPPPLPPNGHAPPPPPPLKDHPQHPQGWNSWGKAHGGPQWAQSGQYQPQQQHQMHLQAQPQYIPHQTTGSHLGLGLQGTNQRPHDLDLSNERNYRQDGDNIDYLMNPRSILAANQNHTATISRHSNLGGLQSPSISSSSGPISPEIGQAWTLERVVGYLERNGFSREWQEAFRNLNIHGTEFLELGQRYHPRLDTVVLPEVARLYGPNADPEREKKAAKSLKKFVRDMLKLGANAPAIPPTPPLGGVGPMSPAFFDDNSDKRFLKGSGRPLKAAGGRRSLSDVYDSSTIQGDNPRGSTEFQQVRSSSDQQVQTRNGGMAKSVMNLNNGRGPSPSNIGDASQGNHSYGPYVLPGSRSQIQESPQNSPSPSFQPSNRHVKSNSQESVASSGQKNEGSVSRWTTNDQKAGKETKGRASGRPSAGHGNEGRESVSKFGGGKMMSVLFSRRNRTRDDDSHDDIDSPTSPSFFRPPLPFIHEHNYSDSSIATASTVSEQDRGRRVPGQRQTSAGIPEKQTVRVFATTNLKMFALVDLTELETPDAIRKALCMSLNIQDWDNASIYHTEVGQFEHEEILSDKMLTFSRRHADDKATVKFYIQPYPQSYPNQMTSNTQNSNPAPNNTLFETPRQLYPVNAPVVRKPLAPPTPDPNQPKRPQVPAVQYTPPPKPMEPLDSKQAGDSLDDLLGRLKDFKTHQDAGSSGGTPKIGITKPAISSPAIVQRSPNDASPTADVGAKGPNTWDEYENHLRQKSLTEQSPIDYNDQRPSSSDPRNELFLPPGAISETDRPTSSEFTTVVNNYQINRDIEERKRKNDQGLRLQQQQSQQQALEKNSGFSKFPNSGRGVIDFDNPRASPFEDKSFDNMIPLVPHRNPPPPPPEASHRSSIGSLTRRGEETFRTQFVETIGYVPTRKGSILMSKNSKGMRDKSAMRKELPHRGSIEGTASSRRASQMSIPIQEQPAQPAQPTQPTPTKAPPIMLPQPPGRINPVPLVFDGGSDSDSPTSPGPQIPANYTWEPNDPFTTPDYAPKPEEGPEPLLPIPTSKVTAPSAPVSPGGVAEEKVEFPFDDDISFTQPTEAPEEYSEEDSDEDNGLFAIPLAGRGDKGKDSPAQAQQANSAKETSKPALTVSTKGVTFKATPLQSAVGGGSTPNSMNDEFHQGDDRGPIYSPAAIAPSPRSAGPSVHSPADYPIRNNAFVQEEVWATRPAPEALFENLDEYFQNIDLDQPMIDDSAATSPPPSPSPISERPRYAMSSSALPMPGDNMPMGQDNDEDDGIGASSAPVEPTLKAPRPTSVAARNVNRASGGLGRMKSIREVARGAHERGKKLTQQQPAAGQAGGNGTVTTLNKQDILRRKSTKLFGARLIEVKPGSAQGKRAMQQLQSQEPPPQSQWPKRQATFRWFKGPLIGKGTYGRVYLGMNATTGDFLAVKQVEVNKSASNGDSELLKEMIAALNQEIETMQHLDHVNIVQYLGCERKELSISIFLEYISGGSIGSCLKRHGKFDEDIVRSLTRQTLSGLEYLHSQEIMHRDLKADNILLDEFGTCKISDFGISKKSENIYGNDPGNSMQGSVFWMAPEVIRPEGQGYSAKIDIWSLGCVVLEMFAGRRPWSTEEAIGAIYKLGSERIAPPIPDDVAPFISPAAIAFLADCHTIEPSERPTARTLLNEHPFCAFNANFNFMETSLHLMIKSPPAGAKNGQAGRS